MNKKTLLAIGGASVVLALISSFLTLAVTAPAGVEPSVFHSLFFIAALMIITHFGGAALFLVGLRGFSARFKAAYGWLVVGFVSLALGFLQLPLITLWQLNDSAWSQYGLIAIPFIFSIVAIYVGTRGFARLFGVHNVLTSAWKATGLALIISGLSVLIPHAASNTDIPISTILISKFAVMLPAMFNLWAAILGYQARKRAGSLYIPATAWLAVYLILDSVSSLAGFGARLAQPGQNVAFDAGYMYTLYAIAGVVLVKAGIEFNKISRGRESMLLAGDQTFFGSPKNRGGHETSGHLSDVLIYTAGLSSSTQAVDPILDGLRMVTSRHAADKPFDTSQQQRLAETYLRLEIYLTQEEPIRPLKPEELRSSLQKHFATILEENPVFKKKISGSE
ncbi:MAG TPA: hypothetical protein VGO07_07510 [Candidatus Saccharimonadales bacterium]|nr:hypothetical protein [Candidatus Saccharimonadales bacterium]